VKRDGIKVAFFPDAYHEIDGVANTSRHFEAFAQGRGLPLLVIHAGPRNEIVKSGSVSRMQFRRSHAKFSLDRAHEYDLLFARHYSEAERLLRDFAPDVVQITGPSDLGSLGALLAHRLGIPLAATWQTNLHQYARSRVSTMVSLLPKPVSDRVLRSVEHWSFRALARFYRIPRLLFAPNAEIVNLLEKVTGKPCCLMPHSVDTAVFSHEFRDRRPGPFRIGYVGRLTPEKSVRTLARLESSLLSRGYRDFLIVIVGQGVEEKWLRKNMRQAEFTGVLTGKDLSREFANMDVFVFPSESDTFGLAVLEALSSGVPAIVTATGGPKFTVQHGKTGYIAQGFDDLLACTELLLARPDLLSAMSVAAREYAVSTSWNETFESMYNAYNQYLYPDDSVTDDALDLASSLLPQGRRQPL
jgi:phosphatidylinositol alpha 1,6-mannosyltransferase